MRKNRTIKEYIDWKYEQLEKLRHEKVDLMTEDADLVVCLGSKHCVTQSDLAEYLEYVVSKSIELDNKSCE